MRTKALFIVLAILFSGRAYAASRWITDTFTTASVSASSSLAIDRPIPWNSVDIGKVKVVPSVLSGTTTIGIYSRSTCLDADMAYKSQAFSGNLYDPVQRIATTQYERNESLIATYDDLDAGKELHIKITNASSVAKTYQISISYARTVTSERVSVKDYGAKGDGATDDTAAFTAALTACNKVYAPASTYIVSNFSIPANGELSGDGIDATILKGSAASAVITASANNVHLHDFTIDGNSTATYGLTVSTWNSRFENIKITKTETDGVLVTKGLNLVFKRIISDSNNGNGLHVIGRSAAHDGYYLTTASWEQCEFGANEGIGFFMEGHSFWAINWINCIFEQNGLEGFKTTFTDLVGTSPSNLNWKFDTCYWEGNNSTAHASPQYDLHFGVQGGYGNTLSANRIIFENCFIYAMHDDVDDVPILIGTPGIFYVKGLNLLSASGHYMDITFPIAEYTAGGIIDLTIDRFPTSYTISHPEYTLVRYESLDRNNSALGKSGVVNNSVIFQVGASADTDYDLTSPTGGATLMGLRFGPSLRMEADHAYHYGLFLKPYSIDDGTARTLTNQYNLYIAAPQKGASTTVTNSYGLFVEAPTSGSTLNWGIYNNGSMYTEGAATFNASATIAAASGLYWNGRSYITSPTNGNLKIARADGTTFGLLQFGGTTSSFPALKRASTGLTARLADDSADTIFQAANFIFSGSSSPAAADACTAGTITWDSSYIYVCTASGAWKRAALTGGY